ncbi:replicative DNA helicase [Treponema primitia ZAS-2]|uniref:Replicative DNA helicase n=1 Tax=Treponema primitia (strain ATCC BAA-887 / DSM 12427 / ZAS-2) TaxID=545694 RepID=F5YR56_TREPZ|nr:replicative DNA helicase [Treponema primitia]AEF86987.1 replicative DNA helicase [Treponema primitia ZAS-2]
MASPALTDSGRNPADRGPKPPPHNDEAEQASLGAMLQDEDGITTVIQYLRPDDFYSNANRRVYAAILSLFNQGRKADIITITEELRQAGELEQAGGSSYVSSLTHVVPSSANVDFYSKIVQDCSLRRALLKVANELSVKSFDESQESRIILEETQQRIFDLTEGRKPLSFKSAKEILPQVIETIEKLYHSKDAYTGVPSGFEELDSMTSGFQPSELIIIGARPSVGKTALALTMAANISINNKERKIPTAFFTLEMSDKALMQRLISSEANIESNKIRNGLLKPSDFSSLMTAAGRIYEAPLYIVDMPNMKLLDLRAQARRLRVQQKVEIIFIDYLTLISSDNYQLPRHEQIAEISRSLKSLARELGIPIVALSQVRRDAEGKRPNLSDIRESGSIEQDADVVMFLHRERESDKKNTERENAEVTTTELIIAKQRNGPVGTIEIAFLPRYTKFAPLTRQ